MRLQLRLGFEKEKREGQLEKLKPKKTKYIQQAIKKNWYIDDFGVREETNQDTKCFFSQT